MTNKRDWNYERYRTRDLLLEYDKAIMPPRPRAAGLSNIYPWENTSLSIFSNQLYKVALMNGFVGTEKEFLDRFVNYVSDKQIVFENYDDFPQYGSINKLYFDQIEKILYYWDEEYIPVNTALIINNITNE